ncbi:FtsK/SpoIIIE domain-containing protein [Streptomyces catenulae]|uniref:FtsK/SpoIIIE domain-containing protein n=1 Tax=Streptomyces catenulae TaxID=66875 RepID=A0ABV2Z7P8_9ACTN|nr:FtsK/SpoIIIE domain-containing protein [Streptomyces catenulae]
MARRPLPRILTDRAPLTRGRELARTAADGAGDIFHPLITLSRGLRRLAVSAGQRWRATPQERRAPMCFLTGACILAVALAPYGPLLGLLTVMGAAAWAGRDRSPAPTGPGEAESARLRVLYEALVPYFAGDGDPEPLYTYGGDWAAPFEAYAFDDDGRIEQLHLRYPAYFTDGEPAARARIEQVLHAKAGRGREYRFDWDEEANTLTLTVLEALPTDITAQRFVTGPGETVLGFTDPESVQRTLPVTDGEVTWDEPPVVWRSGARSTEPHLLVLGQPGSGTTTLLRSLALQALLHGDVLIIDGGGTGEFGALAGRAGVLGVESGPSGALATLAWAAQETERRLLATSRARQAGEPAPDDTRRPLWILADRPTALTHLAAAEGHDDPQRLLQVPLRHGRAAQVTVVVAEQFDNADLLSDPVRVHTTRARVVLGPAAPDALRMVLGAEPHTTPTPVVPPGRGYARLGAGPVLRLQVPATPDPHDETAGEAERRAVLALLPERTVPAGERSAGRPVRMTKTPPHPGEAAQPPGRTDAYPVHGTVRAAGAEG